MIWFSLIWISISYLLIGLLLSFRQKIFQLDSKVSRLRHLLNEIVDLGLFLKFDQFLFQSLDFFDQLGNVFRVFGDFGLGLDDVLSSTGNLGIVLQPSVFRILSRQKSNLSTYKVQETEELVDFRCEVDSNCCDGSVEPGGLN